MMVAPLIGINGRRTPIEEFSKYPKVMAGRDASLYWSDYARGVAEAGGLPVYLSMDADAAAVVERLDGVLITGGADIDPSEYGQEAETELYGPEPERDAYELALYSAAVEQGVPVLAICRGIQLINVAHGGTLHQDLPEHRQFKGDPLLASHGVTLAEGTTLAAMYGESAKVNSLHHQSVAKVGHGFTVAAVADDGTIEALESDGHPAIAVQWHPEMLGGRSENPIFAWLVNQAQEFANR